MRDVKRDNPAASCSLNYDTLYVDKKCWKYNAAEGRVVEHTVSVDTLDSGHAVITSLNRMPVWWTGLGRLWVDPLPTCLQLRTGGHPA